MTLQFLDLTLFKKHVKIEDNIQDDELTLYLASAEQEALNYMERTLESIYEDYGCIPADIILACYVHAATACKYREEVTSVTYHRLPWTWEAKLIKYKPENKV